MNTAKTHNYEKHYKTQHTTLQTNTCQKQEKRLHSIHNQTYKVLRTYTTKQQRENETAIHKTWVHNSINKLRTTTQTPNTN